MSLGSLELLGADALRIAGRDAFRVLAVAGGRRGATLLDLTWIAHEGLIHLVAGVVGEGLDALSRRSGSVWAPAYAALVNALARDSPPPAGRLVKIAVEEPCSGPGRPPAGG